MPTIATDPETRLAATADAYRRLRRAAEDLVDGARPAGGSTPMCAVEPHLIRRLRRELAHQRQPTPVDWMSVS